MNAPLGMVRVRMYNQQWSRPYPLIQIVMGPNKCLVGIVVSDSGYLLSYRLDDIKWEGMTNEKVTEET